VSRWFLSISSATNWWLVAISHVQSTYQQFPLYKQSVVIIPSYSQ
jgi:hypothetical protein